MKKKDKTKKPAINYFSDLFVAVMVLSWVVVIIVMIVFAIYSTILLCDTSVWSYLTELVTIPLSAGGALWMLKNSVQHAIANRNGKQVPFDFPAVNAVGEADGTEQEYESEDLG